MNNSKNSYSFLLTKRRGLVDPAGTRRRPRSGSHHSHTRLRAGQDDSAGQDRRDRQDLQLGQAGPRPVARSPSRRTESWS